MTSKKDMLKSKLQQATPAPAELLFSTGTAKVKAEEKTKSAKQRTDKTPAKEVVHRKDTRVKEEYARVNLFMPPDLKENASLLAGATKSNLSQLIIQQLEKYVSENSDTLKMLKKLNRGA